MDFGEAYANMVGGMMAHWNHSPPTTNSIFRYSESQMREHAAAYVPNYMIDGAMAWIMDAQIPGGFLSSLLRNDLMDTIAAADSENQNKLRDWVVFLHNFTPTGCHGSQENFTEWHDIGGLNGMAKRLREQTASANEDYENRDKEASIEVRKRGNRTDEHAGE